MFANSHRLISAVVVLGVCSIAGASCSSSKSSGGGSCTPFDTQECSGPGACKGGQMCKADGTGWTSCDCGSTATAGSGGATAGSGGAPAGTGGAAAGTGGTEMSGCETDAGVLLPAPVLDPTGTYGGKTYAEWGAAYDQWLLGLPGPDFPIQDSTGAFCAVGQSAASDGGAPQTNVFFLADSSADGAWGFATRNCTIPSGEMIFIPLTNWWFDNAGIPEGTWTDDQLKSNLTAFVEAVTGLSLQIDVSPLALRCATSRGTSQDRPSLVHNARHLN